MTKKSQLERLTQVQLIQKIIHLESELSLYRTDRENKYKRFQAQIIELKHDKAGLKGELQQLLDEREEYYQERDDLIKEYNELLLKTNNEEKQILSEPKGSELTVLENKIETYEKEQAELKQMLAKLKNEAEIQKEKETSLLDEKRNLESTLEMSNKKIAELEAENDGNGELAALKLELEQKAITLEKISDEKEQLCHEHAALVATNEELQNQLVQNNEKLVLLQEQIPQLEAEKAKAFEASHHLKTELAQEREKQKEREALEIKLEHSEVEIRNLEKENEQFKKEKGLLLRQVTQLEEENLSFHERLLKLTELREHDEKRLDRISTNLNEVFKETKQLVRMTSSLKHQLELKVLEMNQMKEDKKLLETELNQLKSDYHQSELRNKELENKIVKLDSDLQSAKQSLTNIKQLETEKMELSEELETKMEEFIMITEDYQREKETYLGDVETLQRQLKDYKEKTSQFEKEQALWDAQMTELNHELKMTQDRIQKKEELENKLTEELRAKEIALYKITKENELALLKKTNEFNSESKLNQENLLRSEQIREKLENQMNEMKAQFQVLEASLEEKENFIKSFIKQPLSQSNISSLKNEEQNQQSLPINNDEQPLQAAPIQQPQAQQSFDWFQRIKSQQSEQVLQRKMAKNHYTYQPIPQKAKPSNNAATMDFFTLRNKTTQPMNPLNRGNQE